eukprot:Clim_evm20s209 gene=Clim_evmTU20s209
MPDQAMRGLHSFIADIRNAKSKELESKRINKELGKIRDKFRKDGKITGYERKKYICKLIYMHLYGLNIDFGHVQATQLMSSDVYTEKAIGYLFMTTMVNENDEMARLLVEAIRHDLTSIQDFHVGLALNAIGNIAGKEMADELAGDVLKRLVANDAKVDVKKKAALALLRLYRKSPECFPESEWNDRIIKLIDDSDSAVCQSVVTLISVLALENPVQYAIAVPKIVARLNRMVTTANHGPHFYYDVNAPWLQVRMLRFLQIYPVPKEDSVRSALIQTLNRIIAKTEMTRVTQHNNARNAILFECVQLISYYEEETELVLQAVNLLGRYLHPKETNLKYLALESLTDLCGIEYAKSCIKDHTDIVIQILKDRDISVRRKAIDLLYALCDHDNAKRIVKELIHYLERSDYEIREDLVLKAAFLAEAFAEDYTWYVDTILRLIKIAGDHVSHEVWHRVVQIIINQKEIQGYATGMVFNALTNPTCHENMVKVGAYILGEFGNEIAGDPRSSGHVQFELLKSKFPLCGDETKHMVLTAFVKLVNLSPDTKDEVLQFLKSPALMRNPDVELQQRAFEYVQLIEQTPEDLFQTVLDMMPPFPERESGLAQRLAKQKEAGERAQKGANEGVYDAIPVTRGSATGGDFSGYAADAAADAQAQQEGDLINGSGQPEEDNSWELQEMPMSGVPPQAEQFLQKFWTVDRGVVFEDDVLQIGAQCQFKDNLGRYTFFYGNKTSQPISALDVKMYTLGVKGQVRLQLKPPENSELAPQGQTSQVLNAEALEPFEDHPIVFVTYAGPNGVHRTAVFYVPIFITKFSNPVPMQGSDFIGRWKTLDGKQSQQMNDAKRPIDMTDVQDRIQGLNMEILQGVDPNPANVVAAGIIKLGDKQVGVLMRLETSREQQKYNVTIRALEPYVASLFRKAVEAVM